MTEWHTLESQEAIRQMDSNLENGLTAAEAERRLAEHGPNELVERVGISPWTILLEQFKGIMVVMLIVSAIVSVISIPELTFQGLEIMSATYLTFEVWITITILYFVLTFGVSLGVRRLENAWRY